MRHRTREEADDPRLGGILHIDDVARVERLAAVGFKRLRNPDDEILELRVARRIGIHRHDMMVRNGADGLERFLLVDEAGQLLAICHADEGRIRYDRVIAESFTP